MPATATGLLRADLVAAIASCATGCELLLEFEGVVATTVSTPPVEVYDTSNCSPELIAMVELVNVPADAVRAQDRERLSDRRCEGVDQSNRQRAAEAGRARHLQLAVAACPPSCRQWKRSTSRSKVACRFR